LVQSLLLNGPTRPLLHIAPADQRAPEIEERLVDIIPPLVADFVRPC
jgi:hypothetical protein